MEKDEAQREAILSILVRARVLRACPQHADSVFQDQGDARLDDARWLANKEWDSLTLLFKTRREMLHELRDAAGDLAYAGDHCEVCGKRA
jgi:hypothetical protein